MTAAYRLHQAGIAVQVFEARDRIGGRCWSMRGFEHGQIGEHGGEFIDTRHVHLRVLADELGLELDDFYETYLPGQRWLSWVDGEVVRGRDLYEQMDQAIERLQEIAVRDGSYFADRAGPEAIEFDQQTMAAWIDANTPAGMDSPFGRLFASDQAGWWGLDPDQLSATNLIDYYAVEYPGGDERYTINGGNDQVPSRCLDALPAGTVTLEAPLTAIRTSGDRSELRFDGVADPVVTDRVILTLPFTTLRDVDIEDAGFSDRKREAIAELGMGTNAKLLMQFDRPFDTFDDWGGGLRRGGVPQFGTWDSGSTDSRAKQDNGLLTVYSGGRAGADIPAAAPHAWAPQDVVDPTLAAIDQAVPDVSEAYNGLAWLDVWAKDPWVHGSYAAFPPGQLTKFWGILGRSEAAVHFAGEHTSVYSQGFLNGGVESGTRAAGEVLQALGVPLPDGIVRSHHLARRYEPVYPWEGGG